MSVKVGCSMKFRFDLQQEAIHAIHKSGVLFLLLQAADAGVVPSRRFNQYLYCKWGMTRTPEWAMCALRAMIQAMKAYTKERL